MTSVFISHSGKDSNLVKRLITLLRSALNLHAEDIRATSVDGFRLPVGYNTDELLRQEVNDAKILIGLISRSSINSAYVIFELGARWGSGKPMFPVLAPGFDPGSLEGPLRGINALSCNSRGQLHQLLKEISGYLGVPLDQAAAYEKYIDEVIAIGDEFGPANQEAGQLVASNPSALSAVEPTSSILVLNETPKLIEGSRPDSGDTVGSSILKSPQGTLSTWLYLHESGQGIRRLVNNRYIFACSATRSEPHRSVIALCRGPKRWGPPPREPSWKIWLVNSAGESETWPYPDGGEFRPGWHCFVLRWNHGVSRLELVIDGRPVIVAENYYRYWPKSITERVEIGHWPGTWAEHYIDSYLWRTQLFPACTSDTWISQEMDRSRPADPT